jgi:hypothetical protein
MGEELAQLKHDTGIAGCVGVAVAVVVTVVLAVLLWRLLSKRLNTPAFVGQIRKLLAAKNVDRARKLASVAGDGPTVRLVRLGLNSWSSNPDPNTPDADRAARAREDMARNVQNVLRPLLWPIIPAQLVGLAGIACLTLLIHHRMYATLVIGGDVVIGLLMLFTALVGRALRAEVMYTVEKFSPEPSS